ALQALLRTHAIEQALLANFPGVAGVPVVQAHDETRQARQVDNGPYTERVQHLAGPEVADLVSPGGDHGFASTSSLSSATFSAPASIPPTSSNSASSAPTFPAVAKLQSGGVPTDPSSRISPTAGSTSRSELRTVKGCQASRSGLSRSPCVTPSFSPR